MKKFLFLILNKILSILSGLILLAVDFRIFRNIGRFFVRRFSPREDVRVNVQGHVMYARTLDRIIVLFLWKFSSLENYESSLIDNALSEGMTAVDVGANIGYYALRMAKLVGPNGVVHAFEPDPENYRLLVKNIEANQYKNIVAVQKAVSRDSGKVNLFFCEEHRGDHRIYDSHDGRKNIEVETTSLDEYFSNNSSIDVIKVDVQGAEFLVLEGMTNLVRDNQGVVLITEFTPRYIQKCGFSAEKFLEALEALDFQLNLINEKKRCLESISVDALMSRCNGNQCVNLYLVKN